MKEKIRRLERLVGESRVTLYLEDGEGVVIDKEDVLDLLCGSISHNIGHEAEQLTEQERDLLLKVDEGDSRNDECFLLMKRLIQNKPTGGYPGDEE